MSPLHQILIQPQKFSSVPPIPCQTHVYRQRPSPLVVGMAAPVEVIPLVLIAELRLEGHRKHVKVEMGVIGGGCAGFGWRRARKPCACQREEDEEHCRTRCDEECHAVATKHVGCGCMYLAMYYFSFNGVSLLYCLFVQFRAGGIASSHRSIVIRNSNSAAQKHVLVWPS